MAPVKTSTHINVTRDLYAEELATENCPLEVLEHFRKVYQVQQWKEEGFFEDGDLLDIACHWMKFEPIRPSVHLLLSIIYTIVFLVGFFSNTIVIYVVSSSKKLRTPTNILLTNLAISDLMTVLMIPIFLFNSFHQGPAIGKSGCTMYGFLTGLSGTCSIMSLTAVSIERYLVISHPLNLRWKPTRHWAYSMSLSAWLYSAFFASLPLFGVSKYVPEGFLTGCSYDYLSDDLATRIFILVFFIGAWMIPMIIIVNSYVAIFRAVVLVRRDVTTIPNSAATSGNQITTRRTIPLDNIHNNVFVNEPINEQASNVEVRVAKTIMGLIGAWTVAWTPYAVVSLIGITGYGHFLTPFSAMLPALFAKLATCVDPFIYTLYQPTIRKEILSRLGLLPPINPSADVATPYYLTDGFSRRVTNHNSSRYRITGALQQPMITGRQRSNVSANILIRAPPYSSIIWDSTIAERTVINQRDTPITEALNRDGRRNSMLLNDEDQVGEQQREDVVIDAPGE